MRRQVSQARRRNREEASMDDALEERPAITAVVE